MKRTVSMGDEVLVKHLLEMIHELGIIDIYRSRYFNHPQVVYYILRSLI